MSDDRELLIRVSDVLKEIGIPTNIKGYKYVRQVVS